MDNIRKKGWNKPGPGRPKKEVELLANKLAISAIERKYGSIEDGFLALLNREPALIKWVFEHAAGKPTENINMNVDGQINAVQMIRLPDNGRDEVEPEDDSHLLVNDDNPAS